MVTTICQLILLLSLWNRQLWNKDFVFFRILTYGLQELCEHIFWAAVANVTNTVWESLAYGIIRSHTSNARASVLCLLQREERYLTFTRARGNYMVTSSMYTHPSVWLLGYTDILIVSDQRPQGSSYPFLTVKIRQTLLSAWVTWYSHGKEIPCSGTWSFIQCSQNVLSNIP
jgi:hypothetical protein